MTTIQKRQVKSWVCDECGRRMTEKQAATAMRNGCLAGCSGLDVHEIIESKCDGCGELAPLTAGEVLPRFMPGTVATVRYCTECWDIVDHCDPETGSFGAGCCDVRRADQPMGVAVE